MSLPDITGAIGVFILLLAYFMNLFGYLKNNTIGYSLLNAIGAATAGIASYLIHYWPFVILEFSWTIVSIIGLIKVVRKSELHTL